MIWAKPMGAATAPLVFLGLAVFSIIFNVMGVESVLAAVREAGVVIKDLSTEDPDLEDVFMSLTYDGGQDPTQY